MQSLPEVDKLWLDGEVHDMLACTDYEHHHPVLNQLLTERELDREKRSYGSWDCTRAKNLVWTIIDNRFCLVGVDTLTTLDEPLFMEWYSGVIKALEPGQDVQELYYGTGIEKHFRIER